MPILVPQLSVWCRSQASRRNQSMSGSSSTFRGARPAASLAALSSCRALPPSPSLLSGCVCTARPQLCLYHRGWRTSPALRNAFSTGRAIPARGGGQGRSEVRDPALPCLLWAGDAPPAPGRCCSAPPASRESAEKTSSPWKIADSPGLT